jgi:hypothetical protein
MAVLSLMRGDQLKCIVQGEALVSEISAPGYAPIRRVLEANSRFRGETWTVRMSAACVEAREAWMVRELADNAWEADNFDVRALVDRAARWRNVAGAALRYAAATNTPGAASALRRWMSSDTPMDSYEEMRTHVGYGVLLLAALDAKAYDLDDAFLAEGRELAAQLGVERSDADGHKSHRLAETDRLAKALEAIVWIAEELAQARELAVARTGEDLPGFDLTYIRAAGAGRRQAEGDATAPADGARGL